MDNSQVYQTEQHRIILTKSMMANFLFNSNNNRNLNLKALRGIFFVSQPLPLYHSLERVCIHISCHWQESVGHPSYDLQFQMSEL